MGDRAQVRAAGGLVIRQAVDGDVEVLLIHRPHRDDWTFPKGKAEPGESDEACALREVEEETGLRCVLVDRLPTTAHLDHRGRRKVVRYWLMRPIDGDEAEPRNEVDAVRWLSLGRAARTLTYPRDRLLLDALAALVV